MDRKLDASKVKENYQISKGFSEKSHSEFVKIPIRILKNDENENSKTYNIESIMEKYIKKPKINEKFHEVDKITSTKRTIAIRIKPEVNPYYLQIKSVLTILRNLHLKIGNTQAFMLKTILKETEK